MAKARKSKTVYVYIISKKVQYIIIEVGAGLGGGHGLPYLENRRDGIESHTFELQEDSPAMQHLDTLHKDISLQLRDLERDLATRIDIISPAYSAETFGNAPAASTPRQREAAASPGSASLGSAGRDAPVCPGCGDASKPVSFPGPASPLQQSGTTDWPTALPSGSRSDVTVRSGDRDGDSEDDPGAGLHHGAATDGTPPDLRPLDGADTCHEGPTDVLQFHLGEGAGELSDLAAPSIPQGGYHIFVKHSTDDIALDIDLASVPAIKSALHERLGIQPSMQCLVDDDCQIMADPDAVPFAVSRGESVLRLVVL